MQCLFVFMFLSFHPVCLTILQCYKFLFAEKFIACNTQWSDVDDISGEAYFTVWMAETPLELDIPDDNLAQISSWRIPDSIEKWVEFYKYWSYSQTLPWAIMERECYLENLRLSWVGYYCFLWDVRLQHKQTWIYQHCVR